MGLPQKKPATYEDLLAVPDHLVGEIVDGELHASPRPSSSHARATTNLTGERIGPFGFGRGGGSGGWIILVEATHSGDAKVRAEPFEAIEIELALLWSR